MKHFKPPTAVERKLSPVKQGQLLSKSMEKTFRRYQANKAARRAFVESEAGAFLAHQIRVLRSQRGWTQSELAKRMGTSPSVVSRLEDPGYGRVSLRTMIELATAFDVAPVLMFKSTIQLMRERWTIDRRKMEVPAFEEEAQHVGFVDPITAPETKQIKFEAQGDFQVILPSGATNRAVNYAMSP